MAKDFEKQLLARYYLEQQAKKNQTKEKLEVLYEQFKKDNPPQEEMSAAHILLKTEKKRRTLFSSCKKGLILLNWRTKFPKTKDWKAAIWDIFRAN